MYLYMNKLNPPFPFRSVLEPTSQCVSIINILLALHIRTNHVHE